MKLIIGICVFSVIFNCIEAAPTVKMSVQEAEEFRQDMKLRENIGLACLKEVKPDIGVIERALKNLEFAEDKGYKEFLACSYKKQGFQDEDGNILYDNIEKFLNRFYSLSDLKILDKCRGTAGSDHGELAVNAMKCIIGKLQAIEN